MTPEEQIIIIKDLLEMANELNGEYQSGWDPEIAKGEELLKHLESQL